MPDREKILRGAECCKYIKHSANGCPEECPYLPKGHLTCGLDPLLDDVIALVREREPVAPTEMDVTPVRMEYSCGECGGLVGVESAIQGAEKYRHAYCPKCGKKVKWDAAD